MSAPELGQVMTIEQRSRILRQHHEERAAALFATMLAMRCGVVMVAPLPERKSRVAS